MVGTRPDGKVVIRCVNCGEVICIQEYSGFSTALCIKCQQAQAELKKAVRGK